MTLRITDYVFVTQMKMKTQFWSESCRNYFWSPVCIANYLAALQ